MPYTVSNIIQEQEVVYISKKEFGCEGIELNV